MKCQRYLLSMLFLLITISYSYAQEYPDNISAVFNRVIELENHVIHFEGGGINLRLTQASYKDYDIKMALLEFLWVNSK